MALRNWNYVDAGKQEVSTLIFPHLPQNVGDNEKKKSNFLQSPKRQKKNLRPYKGIQFLPLFFLKIQRVHVLFFSKQKKRTAT